MGLCSRRTLRRAGANGRLVGQFDGRTERDPQPKMKRNRSTMRTEAGNRRWGSFDHIRPKLTGRVGQIAELIKERSLGAPRSIVDAILFVSPDPALPVDE